MSTFGTSKRHTLIVIKYSHPGKEKNKKLGQYRKTRPSEPAGSLFFWRATASSDIVLQLDAQPVMGRLNH
jgi:hypothetical protein